MGIRKETFGVSKDGVKVDIYRLTNENGVSATFTNMGGTWISMSVPGNDGTMADVILGYDTLEKYAQNIPHFGAPIGRNANRIGGAEFVLNETTYRLNQNNNKNNLHSGPDFYHNRIWDVDSEESELGDRIDFSLISPDMDQGFPGTLNVRVSYTLTPDNSLIIEYEGLSDQDTIFNMTNHCYFNLAGHNSGSVLDQEVYIDSEFFTMADAESIPTGELTPVVDTPMDFTSWKKLGKEVEEIYTPLIYAGGYDHNYVLNTTLGEPSLAAKLKDPKSGRILEVYTDLPGMHLYTGNFLKPEVTGKEGAVYHARSGVCFETQFFPSAPTISDFTQPVIKAGESFTTSTIFKFVVED